MFSYYIFEGLAVYSMQPSFHPVQVHSSVPDYNILPCGPKGIIDTPAIDTTSLEMITHNTNPPI